MTYNLDPRIVEICKQAKVIEYLESKGIEVLRAGKRWRCKCPLGIHPDHDPSFYITTMPDGAELFRCYGCQNGGNIISLMHLMDKKTKGQVVKELSGKLGIALGKFNFSVAVEPLAEEIDDIFCEEQKVIMEIAQVSVLFLEQHATQDVVNKVSNIYQQLEKMLYLGDVEGTEKYRELLFQALEEYV